MATYDKPGREGPMKLVRWHMDRELIMELPYATEDPEKIRLLEEIGCEVVEPVVRARKIGPDPTPEPEKKEVT